MVQLHRRNELQCKTSVIGLIYLENQPKCDRTRFRNQLRRDLSRRSMGLFVLPVNRLRRRAGDPKVPSKSKQRFREHRLALAEGQAHRAILPNNTDSACPTPEHRTHPAYQQRCADAEVQQDCATTLQARPRSRGSFRKITSRHMTIMPLQGRAASLSCKTRASEHMHFLLLAGWSSSDPCLMLS